MAQVMDFHFWQLISHKIVMQGCTYCREKRPSSPKLCFACSLFSYQFAVMEVTLLLYPPWRHT